MDPSLSVEGRAKLLEVARASITCGLRSGRCLAVQPADYEPELLAPGASFVTLRLAGALRGCIGNLTAERPLVLDVAHNAFAAAFSDPRFERLSVGEFACVRISISLLSEPEPIDCSCEAELLARLLPGRDGLILEAGSQRATFLPAVWTELPEPAFFWTALKRKAGLSEDAWPAGLCVQRYSAFVFEETASATK